MSRKPRRSSRRSSTQQLQRASTPSHSRRAGYQELVEPSIQRRWERARSWASFGRQSGRGTVKEKGRSQREDENGRGEREQTDGVLLVVESALLDGELLGGDEVGGLVANV